MRTLDGQPMTTDAATTPVGSALRIAPAFRASYDDESAGARVSIEAEYVPTDGCYVIREIATRALRPEVGESALRRTPTQALLQAAVAQCVTLQISGERPEDPWITVADLTTSAGSLIPPAIVAEVTKHGSSELRMEVVEILYGASALAGLPPVKALERELGVPHRTAADWIVKARKAGRLEGMNYRFGRQADG